MDIRLYLRPFGLYRKDHLAKAIFAPPWPEALPRHLSLMKIARRLHPADKVA